MRFSVPKPVSTLSKIQPNRRKNLPEEGLISPHLFEAPHLVVQVVIPEGGLSASGSSSRRLLAGAAVTVRVSPLPSQLLFSRANCRIR